MTVQHDIQDEIILKSKVKTISIDSRTGQIRSAVMFQSQRTGDKLSRHMTMITIYGMGKIVTASKNVEVFGTMAFPMVMETIAGIYI